MRYERMPERLLKMKVQQILSRMNMRPWDIEQEVYALCKEIEDLRVDNHNLLDECLKKLEAKNEAPKLDPNDPDIDSLF